MDLVYAGKTIVQRGKEANDQINILGDDGVPVEYHERFWKSELIDFVILQQDAFDDIDANCPIERQQMMYKMVLGICNQSFCVRRFRGVLAVLQGPYQPLPPDELLGVEVGEVRGLPQADRAVCE